MSKIKIIGETKGGFILEASKEDVAALEGLYSHQKKFEVGDLIDVNQLFNKLKTIDIALNDINRVKDCTNKIVNAIEWIISFRES